MEPGTRCPRCGFTARFGKTQRKQVQESYKKAFTPWRAEDDKTLAELVQQQASILEISQALGRQPGAIIRRIELLELRTPRAPLHPDPAPDDQFLS